MTRPCRVPQASELRVEEEALRERLDVLISFRAPGSAAPRGDGGELPEGSVEEEWSERWCKPQPGMLLDAAARAGVAAEDALLVGYDFVDREAASRAGIGYIDQQHLLGAETFGAASTPLRGRPPPTHNSMRIGVEGFDIGFDAERVKEFFVPGEDAKRPRAQAPESFAAKKKRGDGQSQPLRRGDRSPGASPLRPAPNRGV